MLYRTCLANLDDIIVFGRNYIEMLGRLDTALERLEQANLKLKPSKCSFGKTSVTLLGHLITTKTSALAPKSLVAVKIGRDNTTRMKLAAFWDIGRSAER